MLWLCIVSIVIGIVSLVGFVWTLRETDGLALLAVFSAIGILLSLSGGLAEVFNTKTVSYDFPANKYTLEYKVVIIGEKCDTTYMLTKIKTD